MLVSLLTPDIGILANPGYCALELNPYTLELNPYTPELNPYTPELNPYTPELNPYTPELNLVYLGINGFYSHTSVLILSHSGIYSNAVWCY